MFFRQRFDTADLVHIYRSGTEKTTCGLQSDSDSGILTVKQSNRLQAALWKCVVEEVSCGELNKHDSFPKFWISTNSGCILSRSRLFQANHEAGVMRGILRALPRRGRLEKFWEEGFIFTSSRGMAFSEEVNRSLRRYERQHRLVHNKRAFRYHAEALIRACEFKSDVILSVVHEPLSICSAMRSIWGLGDPGPDSFT